MSYDNGDNSIINCQKSSDVVDGDGLIIRSPFGF
jgi:hypothetical protein